MEKDLSLSSDDGLLALSAALALLTGFASCCCLEPHRYDGVFDAEHRVFFFSFFFSVVRTKKSFK